jgi:hypothetical protein
MTERAALTVVRTACPNGALTSALRTYLLNYFRAAATERGHAAAGHGGNERLRGMRRR